MGLDTRVQLAPELFPIEILENSLLKLEFSNLAIVFRRAGELPLPNLKFIFSETVQLPLQRLERRRELEVEEHPITPRYVYRVLDDGIIRKRRLVLCFAEELMYAEPKLLCFPHQEIGRPFHSVPLCAIEEEQPLFKAYACRSTVSKDGGV
jgi:hypothetical protein